MNILIPYSWLKDFLITDLDPKTFAETVSASGPSIERWHTTDDNDVVFDVEITTNRIDAFSVYGLAREAYAILRHNGIEVSLKDQKTPLITNTSGVHYELYSDVDETLCSRFTAVVLDGVTIHKSPKFVTERLEKVGVRSINNVVDTTNYVMWELGQPMHVFDYDKIVGHKMQLRAAKNGEKVTTIDGVAHAVPEGAIVIEDSEKLIDLAGIMGGQNSAVDEQTKRVLLFVQTYNPHVIRKATMHMGFRSEAASRFEKGLDEEAVLPALERATELLVAHANAIVASDIFDVYPKPYEPKTIDVSIATVQEIIGVPLAIDMAASILSQLGFQPSIAEDIITVEVPSFRASDISIPEDIVEEIARLFGYHNIPPQLPTGKIPLRSENTVTRREKQIKTALKYWGYSEIYSNSATAIENIAKVKLDTHALITIRNPLTEDFVAMRTHLLATMLPIISENIARFPRLQIFELSKVYIPTLKGLPEEIRMLTLIATEIDILKVKGIVEQIFAELHIDDVDTQPDTSIVWLNADSSGIFKKDKTTLGSIGMVAPDITKNFGITQPLVATSLYFDDLVKLATDIVKYTPIPKYPPLFEDISFIVDQATLVGHVMKKIKDVDNLILDVVLLDQFVGKGIGKSKKSITLRITYQDPNKLLSDKHIETIRQKIRQHLENTFAATIRR